MRIFLRFGCSFTLLLVAILSVGCVDASKVKVQGVQSVAVTSVSSTGVDFTVGVGVVNGSGRDLKIKDFEADLMSGDVVFAHITLRDKVVVEGDDVPDRGVVVELPMRIRVQSLNFASMMGLMSSKWFTVKGRARVGMGCMGTTVHFSEQVSSLDVMSIIKGGM